jgi:NADH:ubiquinone oxidoreductase subunit 5 (subunit L)/multisubunit Na+/H+ antiporter MnhA subunit
MDFALINAVPFIMAALLAIPQLNGLLTKTVRAWLSAGVMLVLFIALASYFPEVQSIDQSYKAQQGIATEVQHEEESVDDEDHADESSTENQTDELIIVNAITREMVWVPELGLTLSFYLDGLSLIFSLIITGVGAGIFLYAGYYFDDAAEQARFITILFAFAGAMLGLVLSGNLITLFIMWELTSITSFLLIGFKGAKSEAARFGAAQALMVTGIGALALLVSFVLLAAITGDVMPGGGMIFDMAQILQANPAAVGVHPLYTATLILLAIGAFTKSAQFPFHFWLHGAMEAPTPASAYLHSATMVKAGVYLLLRLYPPMHDNTLWTTVLVTFGIGTMLITAVIALFQRDLKGLLAYSTVSWLGALVGMIGLPESYGIKAALIGIIAHALYKAALFLAAGSIDHNTGTRIIDQLGGLRKQMPVIAGVVLVSALSMAGLPIFFGFVTKEVLLDAWMTAHFVGQQWSYYAILVSAALTGTAAFIFIWDVFFKEPTHEIHYHESPKPLLIAPVALAIGTTLFGLLLDPPVTIIKDLVATGVPKAFTLHLLPDSITNPVFLTSLAIVASGFVIFLLRRWWLPVMQSLPLPRATDIYRRLIQGADWIGDQVVKTQSGEVRYYLIVILGTVAATILSTGIVGDLARGQNIEISFAGFNAAAGLRIILMFLAIIAAVYTVIARRHITAALAMGVIGYTIGALILVEPSPDVSLVQFLVETLGTILLIVMLGRISEKQRRDALDKLWQGRLMLGRYPFGVIRDLLIAGAVGFAVFFFALTALANRPERESLATYYLQNTSEEIGIQDVVGAIVTDYRGMDTVIEVLVFSTAAMGVLTLLVRGYSTANSFLPKRENIASTYEFQDEALEGLRDTTNLSTPFTRLVARLVLPLSLLVGLSHIINGGHAPGDGFTAGAIGALAIALWFVVFGYDEATARLQFYSPQRLMRIGMFIVVVNGVFPIIFGLHGGTYLAHVDYGKIIGINAVLHRFGLELTSGLIYEVGIALAVLGGFGAIMEAIAHPREAVELDFDPSTTLETKAVED